MMSKSSIPEVSVVVPVYNIQNDALKCCINSILNQSLHNIEVILVSDGSTQDNIDICSEFAQKDARVIFLAHENKGVSVCRNEGIELAKAEWIAFVDSDDWLEETYLEKLLDHAVALEADIALCDCYVNYSKVQVENRFFSDSTLDSAVVGKDRFFMQFLCPKYFKDNCGVTDSGAPWCKLYRKKMIMDHNLRYRPELRRMQDNVFNLFAYEAAQKIVYFDEPLYHYRKSTSSGFTRYNSRICEIYQLVFDAITDFLQQTKKSEIYWQAFYAKVIFSFYVLLKMDFANRNNPDSYMVRRRKAKDILASRYFALALESGDSAYRTRLENIFAVVMKHCPVDVLFFMYHTKELIWKLKGKGTE